MNYCTFTIQSPYKRNNLNICTVSPQSRRGAASVGCSAGFGISDANRRRRFRFRRPQPISPSSDGPTAPESDWSHQRHDRIRCWWWHSSGHPCGQRCRQSTGHRRWWHGCCARLSGSGNSRWQPSGHNLARRPHSAGHCRWPPTSDHPAGSQRSTDGHRCRGNGLADGLTDGITDGNGHGRR